MMEASLYDKIMDQQRLEPEFFRVGFYGKKFPFFLRVRNLHIPTVPWITSWRQYYNLSKEETSLQEELTFLM